MSKSKFYSDMIPRFSRQWWFGTGRNLVWVAIVTILIWVYADMQFTTEQKFTARVQLVAKSSEDLVIIPGNAELKVTFTLKGSRGGLEKFEAWLLKQTQTGPLKYDVSRHKPGRLLVEPDSILYETADLQDMGLTVKEASFVGEVNVVIDQKQVLSDVPVEFIYTGATLKNKAVISPAKVSISVAKSLIQDIKELRLKTESIDLANVPPDKPQTYEVEIIKFIGGVPVEPLGKTVKVTFEVGQLTGRKTFDINIRELPPPSWKSDNTWVEYELKGQTGALEWRRKIEVSGAKKDIDRLKPEDIDAYLKLVEDDKKPVDSWLSREVVIQFPQDMQVELVGEKPKVSFKMEKRKAVPPPATP